MEVCLDPDKYQHTLPFGKGGSLKLQNTQGNSPNYQIIYMLLRFYCVKKDHTVHLQKREKYRDRFKVIIEYINERYKEDFLYLILDYRYYIDSRTNVLGCWKNEQMIFEIE